MDALMEAGIFRALKPGERQLIACLHKHTNRDTGLCCPGEKTIREETGLSRATIKRARKSLRGRFIEYALAQYNRQGQPVYHYTWVNIPSTSRGKGGQSEPPRSSDAVGSEFPAHFQGEPGSLCTPTGLTVNPKPSLTMDKKPPTPFFTSRKRREPESPLVGHNGDVTAGVTRAHERNRKAFPELLGKTERHAKRKSAS